VKVNDLETLDTEILDLGQMMFKVALDMNVVTTQKLSDTKIPQFNYASLKDCEALRVMVFNGKDMYGTISFLKDTNFGQIGQEWN
jgi:hypothetical protein